MRATLATPSVRVVPVLSTNLGSLRVRELQRLEGQLQAAFARSNEQRLVVDCCAVQMIGAAFVGVMVRLAGLARRMGGDVVLVQLRDDCRQVLERCGQAALCTTL